MSKNLYAAGYVCKFTYIISSRFIKAIEETRKKEEARIKAEKAETERLKAEREATTERREKEAKRLASEKAKSEKFIQGKYLKAHLFVVVGIHSFNLFFHFQFLINLRG